MKKLIIMGVVMLLAGFHYHALALEKSDFGLRWAPADSLTGLFAAAAEPGLRIQPKPGVILGEQEPVTEDARGTELLAQNKENRTPPASEELKRKGGHLALNLWGVSHHRQTTAKERQKINQEHPGLGLRWYWNESWYVSFDYLERNSVAGQTKIWGIGAEKTFFSFGEYKFPCGWQVAHVEYKVPDEGEIKRFGVVPACSIRSGGLAATAAYLAGKNQNVVLGFLTLHFE